MLDWRRGMGNFSACKAKRTSAWENLTVVQPKLRVKRLHVIRIHKVCESMRFDSGPEVFVRVNRVRTKRK